MKDIALAKRKYEIEEASAMVERYEKEVLKDECALKSHLCQNLTSGMF